MNTEVLNRHLAAAKPSATYRMIDRVAAGELDFDTQRNSAIRTGSMSLGRTRSSAAAAAPLRFWRNATSRSFTPALSVSARTSVSPTHSIPIRCETPATASDASSIAWRNRLLLRRDAGFLIQFPSQPSPNAATSDDDHLDSLAAAKARQKEIPG